MKNENQTAAPAKKEYQVPVLSEFGGIAEMTLAANVNGTDGNTQSTT